MTAVVCSVAAVSACTADRDTPAAKLVAPAATSAAPTATSAACVPAPIEGGVLEGRSDDGTSVAALTFRQEAGPVRVGEEVKIVVRITGEGDLAVTAVRPDGAEAPLDWGPEPHSSSTFRQPGDEWGFGVTFDAPGCWTIELDRSEAGAGRLELEVV